MKYNVTQFFADHIWENVRINVSAVEASTVFAVYCTNVSASMGLTKRVIITNEDDYISAEWQYGKGLVFPLPRTNQ